jgi:hypothetical protein
LEPSTAAALRWAIDDYFDAALDISRRMIAGETGVELVDDVSKMQALQAKASTLILTTTGLEGNEVTTMRLKMDSPITFFIGHIIFLIPLSRTLITVVFSTPICLIGFMWNYDD